MNHFWVCSFLSLSIIWLDIRQQNSQNQSAKKRCKQFCLANFDWSARCRFHACTTLIRINQAGIFDIKMKGVAFMVRRSKKTFAKFNITACLILNFTALIPWQIELTTGDINLDCLAIQLGILDCNTLS